MSEKERRAAGRIAKLAPAVVAKIAAGEMILRPLSVAKELIENSIDARAKRIEIEVRGAADRFLSVADDGCGMTPEECVLCVERHATSKIREAEDLEGVATLGFRGEALPSIARVARLRIATSADGSSGTEIRVRGSEVEATRPAGRAPGTTVEVEDLFFNSPVRKRFLRSPAGEIRLIQRLVEAYAIARPEIAFRLTVDGKEWLQIGPAQPLERLEQIHGSGFRQKVLPLEGDHPGLRIRGWIGIPEIARATTHGQTIVVNGRWVSHPALGHAMRQGYGDLLPTAKSPFAVLILETSGAAIDVNIHPTKREIRFADEGLVFAEVVRAVREAARRLVPGIGGSTEGWEASASNGVGGRIPWSERGGKQAELEGLDLLYRPGLPSIGEGSVRESGGGRAREAGSAEAPMVPLWQIQERYIVAQTRQGLLIVDQHAAHERILYEKALRCLSGERAASQQILFTVVVDLDPVEREILEQVADEIQRLGVLVEWFGERSVVLRAVPPTWERDPETMLRELLEDFGARTRRREERLEALAASFACRSAVRSGQKLDLETMNRLVDGLFATNLPHGDPHGRPTYLVLSVEDLDRRFGRA